MFSSCSWVCIRQGAFKLLEESKNAMYFKAHSVYSSNVNPVIRLPVWKNLSNNKLALRVVEVVLRNLKI